MLKFRSEKHVLKSAHITWHLIPHMLCICTAFFLTAESVCLWL